MNAAPPTSAPSGPATRHAHRSRAASTPGRAADCRRRSRPRTLYRSTRPCARRTARAEARYARAGHRSRCSRSFPTARGPRAGRPARRRGRLPASHSSSRRMTTWRSPRRVADGDAPVVADSAPLRYCRLMDWKLELIVVPAADVDRAKAFYTDSAGFTLLVDHSAGEDFRVVQPTPSRRAARATGGGQTRAAPARAGRRARSASPPATGRRRAGRRRAGPPRSSAAEG